MDCLLADDLHGQLSHILDLYYLNRFFSYMTVCKLLLCFLRINEMQNLCSQPGPILLWIDHEIISTVILLPSADSFKKGCCQLQAKVCAQSTD